jgi:transcription elongation factor GreA
VEVESSGKKQTLNIVGVTESNPAKGFISNESPIGKAFLGHKKGDSVKVRIPKGEVEYKILDVK